MTFTRKDLKQLKEHVKGYRGPFIIPIGAVGGADVKALLARLEASEKVLTAKWNTQKHERYIARWKKIAGIV